MTTLHELLDTEDGGPAALAAAEAILLATPTEVHTRNSINDTPLHVAAASGQTDLAKLLLAHGADVNARGDFGKTPLHYAAKEQEVELVELLASNGADLDALDEMRFSPLFLAVQGQLDMEPAAEALLELGATIEGNAAVWLFDATAYRKQLSKNPDLVRKAPRPNCLVNDAVIKRDRELVALLIEQGAPIDGDPANSPVFYAIDPHILRLLLERGANVNATNSFGETALQSAKGRGAPKEILDVLIEFGVRTY